MFNHYNRVRANISYLEAQQAEQDDTYEPHVEDGIQNTRYQVYTSHLSPEHPGVSTARVRPLRKVNAPIPPFPRPQMPIFEKSNVLVMYEAHVLFDPDLR